MQFVTSADTEPVDYTKWSEGDLNRLRTLQRDEALEPSEREAVERELQRRAQARAISSPSSLATPPISTPAPALARNTPVVNGGWSGLHRRTSRRETEKRHGAASLQPKRWQTRIRERIERRLRIRCTRRRRWRSDRGVLPR
jgi:hypothetical protein